MAIVVGKVASPFIWITLPQSTKRGNSRSKHHILIMKRVFKVLTPEDITFLAMDREFNGKECLKWLNQKDPAWVYYVSKETP